MKLDEPTAEVRGMAEAIDASDAGFLAVRANIAGRSPGVFYVEAKDGEASVEPYGHNGRSRAVTMGMTNFNRLIDGRPDPCGCLRASPA